MAYTAVDTWDVESDTWPSVVEVRARGVRSPVDGGMVQRRQTQTSEGGHGNAAVRTFHLTYTLAPKSAYNRAVVLWKKSKGGAEGLSYTVTDTAYTGTEALIVRMVAAPFMVRKLRHGRYAFRVELEEVLHGP